MNELKREARMAIKRLQREHKRSRKHGRGKYGFLRYLQQVYDQFAAWRETPGMASKMRDQIAKSAKLPKVTGQKRAFNVIIAATANEPTRTKSRWAQALL
jgi:ribosomal protein L32E